MMHKSFSFFVILGVIMLTACDRTYTHTAQYSEGLARVQYKGLWGYIDEQGDEVIPCNFEFATDFSGAYAGVKKDGENEKYRFIDRQGQQVGDYYDSICFVKSSWAVVMLRQYYYIIKVDEDIVSVPLDTLVRFGNSYLTASGDSMAMIVYRSQKLEPCGWFDVLFPQKDQRVVVAVDSNQWCLLDLNGNIISESYEAAGSFKPGSVNMYRNGKRWLRNETLTVLTLGISRIFDFFLAQPSGTKDRTVLFSGELLEVCRKGKWGYIDAKGQEVIPLIYTTTDPLTNGFAIVSKNNKFGCYNEKGVEIVPIKYDMLKISGDMLICGLGSYFSKYGVINHDGIEIIPCTHSKLEQSNSLFIAEDQHGNYGVYDSEGKLVVAFQYDDIDEFSDGLAVVEKDDLYGFIDTTGREVIKLSYEYARPFGSNHLAWVTTTNGQDIWIDHKGNKVRNFP